MVAPPTNTKDEELSGLTFKLSPPTNATLLCRTEQNPSSMEISLGFYLARSQSRRCNLAQVPAGLLWWTLKVP